MVIYLACSSFLISVCMFIVSKALLMSSDIVIVRAGVPFGLWCVCVVPSLYSVLCTRLALVCK